MSNGVQGQPRPVLWVGCLVEMWRGYLGMPEPQSDSDASGGGLWVADEEGPLEGQV